MHGKIMRIIRACELSEPTLRYILMNGRELCLEQACELSGACELARVKLSGLYCNACYTTVMHALQFFTTAKARFTTAEVSESGLSPSKVFTKDQ